MPKSNKEHFATEHRRHRVSELYLKGKSQYEIANELQVNQSTISRDILAIQKQWRESGIRNFDLVREVELQKLDQIEREAWAAWERSQKPAQSAEFKDDALNTPTRKRVRNQIGDPRFLTLVHQCIATRRAILLLDSLPLPQKEDLDAPATPSEKLINLINVLRERARAAGDPAFAVDQHSGNVCDNGERRQMEYGAPPGLPGPGDHGVDSTCRGRQT